MKAKKCTSCGVEYPATTTFWWAELRGKYGLRSRCKPCHENLSRRSRSDEAYQRSLEWGRKNYAANREKRAKRYKKYYQENIEYHRNRAKEWGKSNRDKGRATDAKRRENPQYRLHTNMSRAVRQSLFAGVKGGASWEMLVGYDRYELKQHLEKQFTDGMSWDNYGEWHIDHIVPQSAFNFTEPDHIDFKRCWALDNLQPLWAKENLSKNARLDKPFQPALQM